MDQGNREWYGSPLDMEGVMDYHGIREVVIEFEEGETDVFRPRLRDEFHSYELSQMGAYLDTIAHRIRKGTRN